MSSLTLWFCVIILIGSGAAADVPFVFSEGSSGMAGYTSAQLEQASATSPDLAGVPMLSTPSDGEIMEFPVTGGGNTPGGSEEKNVGDLKNVFNARVEPSNSRVHDEALMLVAKFPGDLTLGQICSIYDYLKNGESSIKGWSYARDPRGIDYFMYANESLSIGEKSNCVGVGDCDDFAILMSALVESIGGTTRIVLASNNTTGGHAYAEVYLGRLDVQNSQAEDIISWLKGKFDTDKIYTHIDTDTKDVWLNLDWGPDEKGNAHPGGPFFQGDKHIVLCIRDKFEKTPLRIPEKPNRSQELTSTTPVNQTQNSYLLNTSFTKNEELKNSKDADAWVSIGRDFYSQGNYGDATKACDKAIRIDPNNAQAWFIKGQALRCQDDLSGAFDALEEATRLDPNDTEYREVKGYILNDPFFF